MKTIIDFNRMADCIKREGFGRMFDWLIHETDFFMAPASTKYHGAFEGGLCDHSVNVCLRLNELYEQLLTGSNQYSWETIAIVALLHDVCKVNTYKKSSRNVKQPDGSWATVPCFEYGDDPLPFGHGEKSVFLISRHMRLTDEEAMAINWHMGPFDARSKGGSRTMSDAFNKFPLALYLHQADMLASYIDEKR